MKHLRKALCVLLALSLLAVGFLTPVGASTALTADTSYTAQEKAEHSFYRIVDKLIDMLGKVLNFFIPGLNWTGRISKTADTPDSFMGEAPFDRTVKDGAGWRMGFADASLIDELDVMDGSYYLAGSLEAVNGRVPTKVIDDQRVSVYALSDGVNGTVVHAVLDGYGFARGDVLKLRGRVADFAERNGVTAINVSVLHQHSCIDILGLSAPLLPALVKNPALSLFRSDGEGLSGKNAVFMENLFTVTADAIVRAVGNMREGTLSYGSADITELIHDKREPITFDGLLHRLRFTPDDGGNEIWVCEAGMHCTGYGASADVLSGDYPYYLKQYVKEQTGADLVFVEGAELAITTDYSTLQYDRDDETAFLKAMGKALGDKLIAIRNEIALDPVLNIKITEVSIKADNQVLILAVREGLINSVTVKDGLGYDIVTELGYMELGNKIGVMLAPGELAPELLWGGVTPADRSWVGDGWTYPALADVAPADTLLCFGLTNDQIGYVIPDNDIRSYLTENEEITASSTHAASALAEAFIALIASVG
ncbi:MAG: hypothetical protein IK104_00630 [Clostridia bacterium]|nr:hypothetical protein [Clostridia bacterium]